MHGFWTTRKQRKRDAPNRFESKREVEPKFNADISEEIDDEVIGPVKVINVNDSTENPSTEHVMTPHDQPGDEVDNSHVETEAKNDANISVDNDLNETQTETSHTSLHDDSDTVSSAANEETVEKDKEDTTQKDKDTAPLYADVVTQPKPEFSREKETDLRQNSRQKVP